MGTLKRPFLLLVGIVMIVVALYLHRPTIWHILDSLKSFKVQYLHS
jgi:hypothetical protein